MNINFILGLLCLVVYFHPFHSFIDCLCLFVWIIIMLTAWAAFSQLVQCWDNRHFILGRWVWGAPVDSASQCLDRRQFSDYNCLPTLLCKDFIIFRKVDVDNVPSVRVPYLKGVSNLNYVCYLWLFLHFLNTGKETFSVFATCWAAAIWIFMLL